MVTYDLRASGVVRNALWIAAAARDAGLRVEMRLVRRQGEFLDRVPEGVPLVPLYTAPTARQRDLDSVLAVPRLARSIAARRPHVLFSVGNQMHLHTALALCGRDRGAMRCVGRISNAVAAASPHGARLRPLVRGVERFQFRAFDRLIPISHELGAQLVSAIGIPPGRISVIRNGIDLAAQARAGQGDPGHPAFDDPATPVIVVVGRIARQKDFPTLLRAFAIARRQRPLRLVHLGRGDPGRLSGLAQRLGIDRDVWFAGHVAAPAAFVARAALFVSSSRWEGAGNVILEALACGTPIVATAAPTGIREILEPGDLAPLVPIGDAAALGQAILDRLDRPRDSARLTARAKESDLAETLGRYVDLLRDEVALAAGGACTAARGAAVPAQAEGHAR